MSADAETVRVLKVFVSSPGDVAEERRVLDEVVDRINRIDGRDTRMRLELWKWERDAIPKIGPPPQQVINEQLPDYGIYLGILAKRFGTPTEKYGSGTEQEFRDALERHAQVGHPWIMFFFKKTSLDIGASDGEFDQFKQVSHFRNELQSRGLVVEYTEVRGSQDAFFDQVQEKLRLALRQVCAQQSADDLKQIVAPGMAPNPAPVVTQVARDNRRPILDLISPSYILDPHYYFVDWNPAFEMLVAKPLGLARSDHAVDFVGKLENCAEVIQHSKDVFSPDQDPLADVETLVFKSPAYGRIRFKKLAALIPGESGQPLGWSVNLNILSAEDPDTGAGTEEKLWHDLEEKLREFVNWSRYAPSYDKLLTPFDDYQQLVDLVVQRVGEAQTCVDLGAGTGNSTLKLLTDPRCAQREVWAVESNEAMFEYLKAKLSSFHERLTLIKDDVENLGSLRHQDGYFDAATMINVLYATHDPIGCLRQAYRILKPGGVLVLSTPHRGTDVRKLFQKMREVLVRKGLFKTLEENFEAARKIHERFESLIHRDTKEDVRQYIRDAGFELSPEDWVDSAYVDAVVVAKAVKPLF